MGWLTDLIRPIATWLFQARYGFGYTMKVRISTDPEVFAMYAGGQIGKVSPHLDVQLRVWNTGRGSDVTIISVVPHTKAAYESHGFEDANLLLPKSGAVVPIRLLLYPKPKPLTEFKSGDKFKLTLRLNNHIGVRLKATVT